jgi:hypothetical protein
LISNLSEKSGHVPFHDETFEKWCHELFDILTSDEFQEARETHLTPDEIKAISEKNNGF